MVTHFLIVLRGRIYFNMLSWILFVAQIRDPVNPNVVIPVKNWKIRVVDIQSSRPPNALVNRILGEVVSKSVSQVDISSKLTIEEQLSGKK